MSHRIKKKYSFLCDIIFFIPAAGISGQVQHTVGVNEAGLIVAINKDEHAPIFSNCDYGIIGDVAEVLPLLTEKLKA